MSQSKFMRAVAPNRAVLIQHIIATLALVIAVIAVVSTLVPFYALGFTCGGPLLGAHVLHQVPTTSILFGTGRSLCSMRAGHRLITAIIVFILATTAGVGGWALPLGLPWWLGGEGGPGQPRRR